MLMKLTWCTQILEVTHRDLKICIDSIRYALFQFPSAIRHMVASRKQALVVGRAPGYVQYIHMVYFHHGSSSRAAMKALSLVCCTVSVRIPHTPGYMMDVLVCYSNSTQISSTNCTYQYAYMYSECILQVHTSTCSCTHTCCTCTKQEGNGCFARS